MFYPVNFVASRAERWTFGEKFDFGLFRILGTFFILVIVQKLLQYK